MNEQSTVFSRSKRNSLLYMIVLVLLSGFLGLPLTFRMFSKADFFSPLFFFPCIPLAFNLLGLILVWFDILKTTGVIVHSILLFFLALFTMAGTGGMLHFFSVYG